MSKKTKILTLKYTLYAVTMILLYVLQTTPRFLTILDTKPNFVIPAAVCIAMMEGEFIGGLYGALAGVLCDFGGRMLFGFNAIIVMISCVCVGLLFIYLLRRNIINFVLMVTAAMFVRGLLEYLLGYVMWNYEHVWMVLAFMILPMILYTSAVSPLIYYLYRWINGKFVEHLQN